VPSKRQRRQTTDFCGDFRKGKRKLPVVNRKEEGRERGYKSQNGVSFGKEKGKGEAGGDGPIIRERGVVAKF